MRKLIILVLFVFIIPNISQVEAESHHIRWVTCPYPTPRLYTTECGFLTVPENRSDENSNIIRIAFAVIRSNAENPAPDPLVYLVGGPGGSILSRINSVFMNQFAPFVQNRDLILLDQRGTGYSQPRLYCPEIREIFPEYLAGFETPAQEATIQIEALYSCHDRLIDNQIDLSGYTSAESASDLNDLRLALGYEEWNLLGVSYGSRLALTAMRDYPDGVRSVILDSVYPLQSNLFTEILDNVLRAQTILFTDCENSPSCNDTYPYLEAAFTDLRQELNENPIIINMRHPNFGRIDVLMHGDRIFEWVFNWLYSVDSIEQIPRYIYALRDGDLRDAVIAGINEESVVLFIDMATYFSVQCSEEFRFLPENSFENFAIQYPDLQDYILRRPEIGDSLFTTCENWAMSPLNEVENEPVHSDIPTLVLAGEYDPITPPHWAQETARTLTNHYFYEARGIGHGVTRSTNCGMDIAVEFINNPMEEPNSDCLATLKAPNFVIR